MASFLTSDDFSEISGRDALSETMLPMGNFPSFRISLFASSNRFKECHRTKAEKRGENEGYLGSSFSIWAVSVTRSAFSFILRDNMGFPLSTSLGGIKSS